MTTVTAVPDYNDLADQMLRSAKFDLTPSGAFRVCGLGLAGESGEIADLVKKIFQHEHPMTKEKKLKLLEENGDTLWYVIYLAKTEGIQFGKIIERAGELRPEPLHPGTDSEVFSEAAMKLSYRAVWITNTLSYHPDGKLTFYQREILTDDMALLVGRIDQFVKLLDSSLPQVMGMNIAKLLERYPVGFSTEASLARVDVAGAEAGKPVVAGS